MPRSAIGFHQESASCVDRLVTVADRLTGLGRSSLGLAFGSLRRNSNVISSAWSNLMRYERLQNTPSGNNLTGAPHMLKWILSWLCGAAAGLALRGQRMPRTRICWRSRCRIANPLADLHCDREGFLSPARRRGYVHAYCLERQCRPTGRGRIARYRRQRPGRCAARDQSGRATDTAAG